MFIKIDEKFISCNHFIMIVDNPKSSQGKIACYVWGLKNPIYTNDFVSAESLTKKIIQIKKRGELNV